MSATQHDFCLIHKLRGNMAVELCQLLLAVHTLYGDDYSSKFSINKAALRTALASLMRNFGESFDVCDADVEKSIFLVYNEGTSPCWPVCERYCGCVQGIVS